MGVQLKTEAQGGRFDFTTARPNYPPGVEYDEIIC
jgi:hypothetical protein